MLFVLFTEYSGCTEVIRKNISGIDEQQKFQTKNNIQHKFSYNCVFYVRDVTRQKARLPIRLKAGTIHISVDESYKPVMEEQIRVFEKSFPGGTYHCRI